MIRNLGSFAALSLPLLGLAACGQQEPAAAPLAPPPAATLAPAPVLDAKKEEPKPLALTAEQKVAHTASDQVGGEPLLLQFVQDFDTVGAELGA